MTLLAILTASLLGSLHCAGMCGGFVSLYSAQASVPWLSHAAYSTGRLCTYLMLGALAGLLGSSIETGSESIGIPTSAALVAGILMVLWGGLMLLRSHSGQSASSHEGLLFRLLRRPTKWVLSSGSGRLSWVQAFLVGLLTTLLPCGWLYAWVAVAAATGDPLQGALVMVTFWIGTLPVMLSLGTLIKMASPSLVRALPRAAPMLLVIAGLYSIFVHLSHEKSHTHSHNQPISHQCH